MYTFSQIISDETNKTTRRRNIVVEFVNGDELLSQSFSFGLDTTTQTIKQIIKKYLDDLNLTQESITDIDIPTPTPTAPTQAELDRIAWQEDWRKLQAANKLETNGVTVLTATQKTALVNKVTTGFKQEYVDIV